jgi:hypothetical protein
VSSECSPGIKDETSYAFYTMAEIRSGQMAPQLHDTLAESYEVTVTNTSSVTARITGFAAAFFNSKGQELATNKQTSYRTVTSIPPGEALQWTEEPWGTYQNGSASVGPFAVGGAGSIDRSVTCRLRLQR